LALVRKDGNEMNDKVKLQILFEHLDINCRWYGNYRNCIRGKDQNRVTSCVGKISDCDLKEEEMKK
jgi:hypothetical protein